MSKVVGWIIAVIAAALAATFFLLATAAPVRSMVRIGDDPGGGVVDYLRWLDRLHQANVEIMIEGSCVSACTLVLSLPPRDVCILPSARLGFHLASVNNQADPALTQQLIDRYYPPRVQAWIKDHGPLSEAPIYMMGAEAITLGVMRECEQ